MLQILLTAVTHARVGVDPVGHHGLVGDDRNPPSVGVASTRRPVIVAADLSALRGPLAGWWQLPLHLDASGRDVYDFSDPHRRALAYCVVLLEAVAPDDLSLWLHEDALVACWDQLYLPREVRAAWQRQHRGLALRGSAPHVPAV